MNRVIDTQYEKQSNFNLGSFLKGAATGGLSLRLEKEKREREQKKQQALAEARALEEARALAAEEEANRIIEYKNARILEQTEAKKRAYDKIAKSLEEKIAREKLQYEKKKEKEESQRILGEGGNKNPLVIGVIILVSSVIGFGIYKMMTK